MATREQAKAYYEKNREKVIARVLKRHHQLQAEKRKKPPPEHYRKPIVAPEERPREWAHIVFF